MSTSSVDRITPQLLQWLYNVITPAYTDTRRVYGDVAQALRSIPSLSPRTEAYTYETGRSELLLLLHGTLPATFRGATYNIPVHLWLPHQYPHQAPMVFVVPQRDMLLRPGNHVDGNGRCYHPYLTGWREFFDKSNLIDLCDVLKGVFSREPPVYARRAPPQQNQQQQTPPPVPPLPAELSQRTSALDPSRYSSPPPIPGGTPPPIPPLPRELAPTLPPQSQQPTPPVPPPPPPKPAKEDREQDRSHSTLSSPPSVERVSAPPPLPPAPHRQQQLLQQQQYPGASLQSPALGILPSGSYGSPFSQPLPPQIHRSSSPSHAYSQLPVSMHHPRTTIPQSSLQSQPQHLRYPASVPLQQPSPSTLQRPQFYAGPPTSSPHISSPLNPNPSPMAPPHASPPPQFYPPQQLQSQAPKPKLPIPDLLTNDDTDLLFPLPSAAPSAHPPPPLPPNPQKDHIINSIAQAIHQLALESASKTQTALEQASIQREALQRAESKMVREESELRALEGLCDVDSGILRDRITMAEKLVRELQEGKWVVPEADKLVVATTVVHGQLYDLVCEDMAIEDAMFVLGRALDKEKVGLDVFLKHMRILAREQFIIRATVKKIVKQIGLTEPVFLRD